MSRGPPEDMTVAEAIDLYLRRKRPDWKGETERTYRRHLNLFQDYCAKNDIEEIAEISRWEIGQFTDYLLEKDYARVTVSTRQKAVKTWLKYLESQGIIDIGLHLAVKTIKTSDEEESSDQQLAPEDARKLLEFYRESPAWAGTRRHAVLEIFWHTGCRASGLRGLDLEDYEDGVLKFRNRPETGTRLKSGNSHERNVAISEAPREALEIYIARERHAKRDDHGRKPLFTSRQGRPTLDTIRGWMYQATQACMAGECPHGKRRPNCEWVPRNHASKCPSTRGSHAIRHGSITWQRNLGFDEETVAARVAATPQVIRRYYDDPDLDDELERRRNETEDLDITQHLHPTDLGEELAESEE
jgi:site-specific recombinase XerD